VEWPGGIALVAALIAVRHLAIRRIARGDGRFVWIYFAPTLLVMAWVIWIAIGLWAVQPLAAIGVAVVGAGSLLLFSRAVGRMASDAGTPGAIGELSPPMFDYIAWTSIGVPLLLFVGLVILLLTGALGKSS
jgi:hypothetical protein